MKGVVFLGEHKTELREFPDPQPGPRDVIIEIKASGMCGFATGKASRSRLKKPSRMLHLYFHLLVGVVIDPSA